MKVRVFLALLSVAFSSPVLSQEFLPFTVKQTDVLELQNYLNDNVPPRYSAGMVQWVNRMEQAAQAAVAAALKKADDDHPPAKPEVKK